jgi:hypothetical protein
MEVMKNIHVLPTDKPSRLLVRNDKPFILMLKEHSPFATNETHTYKDIYITSDEKIKEGDWFYNTFNDNQPKLQKRKGDWRTCFNQHKIILTTDQDLIKDGVQAIDDEFLEWFVKNPSCEEVELEVDLSKHNGQFQTKYGWKIIIPEEEPKEEQTKCYCGHTITCDCGPLEEPKQETLKEVAENEASIFYEKGTIEWNKYRQVFELGAKCQSERSYNEEEVNNMFATLKINSVNNVATITNVDLFISSWKKQFKKK